METIFKKITRLNDKVFAEKNRDILLSDYVQKTQPKVEVSESSKSNGKRISIFSDYEMKYEFINELLGYFNSLSNDKNSEESTIKNFGQFKLIYCVEIDFRGCKTQKQKEDKIQNAISEVENSFNNKLDYALSAKIKKLNENLNYFIEYNNNLFVSETISWLTNDDVYNDDFNKNEEFIKLNSEYAEVVEKINALKKIRTNLEDNLTTKKRAIALETLEKDNWQFEDNNEALFIVPQPVIQKTKEAISNAFVYKHGIFH
jgi:stress response protein SCP2